MPPGMRPLGWSADVSVSRCTRTQIQPSCLHGSEKGNRCSRAGEPSCGTVSHRVGRVLGFGGRAGVEAVPGRGLWAVTGRVSLARALWEGGGQAGSDLETNSRKLKHTQHTTLHHTLHSNYTNSIHNCTIHHTQTIHTTQH